MRQLFVRSGKVYLEEIQPPPQDERGILVEMSVAAISVGTEIKSLQGVPRNPSCDCDRNNSADASWSYGALALYGKLLP